MFLWRFTKWGLITPLVGACVMLMFLALLFVGPIMGKDAGRKYAAFLLYLLLASAGLAPSTSEKCEAEKVDAG